MSFKTINIHPKHRVKFSNWLIRTSSVLQTTDAAFNAELECATIFYAIPEFWKTWTPDLRQEVVYATNRLFAGCLPDEYVFGFKRHLMELTKFVRLDKMKQLHVAYMASKRDPSLIKMSNEDMLAHAAAAEVTDNN